MVAAEALLVSPAEQLAAPAAVIIALARAAPGEDAAVAVPVAMIALVAHAVLAAAAFGLVVAEPRGDLVAGAVEEAAVVGVAAATAEIAITVTEAVVGPSGLIVPRPIARVVAVIGHACFSLQSGPVETPATLGMKRTGICGRSGHDGARMGQIGGATLRWDGRLQG